MSSTERVPWIIKYRPRRVEDVVDQEQAKKMFLDWLNQWLKGKPPEKKAVLLYGPAGVGKTSLVEAVAHEYKLELIEMNASDFRRKEDIERIARIAATQSSLFGKKKIILLDEVDGISGTADRGGLDAILDLINNSRHPIVMTANDPWDQRLRPLRDASLMIPFNRLQEKDVVAALKKICGMEGIECEHEALKYIAERSEGDLRSAINDLQSIAESYGKVTLTLVKGAVTSRDRQYSPWEMLRNLFMSKYVWQAKRAVTHTDLDYETLLQWLNENIPVQYSEISDIWRAYEALARADIMLARTKKTMSWDLLSHMYDLAGPGIMLSKRKSKFKWAKYQFPQKITMLSKTREVREIRDAIAEAMSRRLLVSKRRFLSEVLPFVKIIFEEKPDYAARIAMAYNLTDNMVKYLAGARYQAVKEYMDLLLNRGREASTRSPGTKRAKQQPEAGKTGKQSSRRGRQTTLF